MFVSKKFPDTQQCSCFRKSNDEMEENRIQLKSSKIESSSCRRKTTSIGEKQETRKLKVEFFRSWGVRKEKNPKGVGHSSDQELKRGGTERTLANRNGLWSHAAGMMMINLRESAHFFQKNKCVGKRTLEKQRRRRKNVTVISDSRVVVSHHYFRQSALSVYGAVSDWCEELAQQISDPC